MGFRVGCFDFETSSLNANFGVLLCMGIYEEGVGHKMFRIDELAPGWAKGKRSDDSALVRAVAEELAGYDVLVAHNGARFDIPFLRTRMMRWGMGMFPSKKLIDPFQIARNRLRMSSNSLDALTDFIGCNSKTRVSGRLWMEAYLDGSKPAMDDIVEHCIADVDMLRALSDALKDYSSVLNQGGSGW